MESISSRYAVEVAAIKQGTYFAFTAVFVAVRLF
jgi:hypothetical protein